MIMLKSMEREDRDWIDLLLIDKLQIDCLIDHLTIGIAIDLLTIEVMTEIMIEIMTIEIMIDLLTEGVAMVVREDSKINYKTLK